MKILLFGHRGQVGSALINALPPIHQLEIADIDITNDVRLRDIINSTAPDVIINAAAYTNVDGAETESDIAFAVNAHAPLIMAQIAKDNHIRLIHYSTDYVFDGTGTTPWAEDDIPAPLNRYGQSKLDGEHNIINSGCDHVIFRTSWVYGSNGENFITKILQLTRQRQEIQVIADQIGAPTSARFLAAATYEAINQPDKSGIYHLCCAGETSWADYARLIIQTENPSSTCTVIPVLSKDYQQKAQRPLNSRLDTRNFINDFNMIPPDWKDEYIHIFSKKSPI